MFLQNVAVTRVTTTTTQQQIRFGTNTEVIAEIDHESNR